MMKKQIIFKLLIICGVSLCLLSSCRKSSDFVVKGVITGGDGDMMYLENVGLSEIKTLDSVLLSTDGKFKFKKARPLYPDFYRLRLKNQWISFAVDSTETISITGDAGTFATTYNVEGSDNSKVMKEITLAQLDANQIINRLRKEYEDKIISDTTYQRKVLEAAEEYKDIALKHIYKAPMSTAAYYALFQQVDGLLFFDLYDKKDLRAYGAVATSLDHFYPESPRAKQLSTLTLQAMKVLRAQRPMSLDGIKTDEISYVDIALPNIQGDVVKLSDVAPGKTVIVNFTAYQSEWSPAFNTILSDLYSKYHDKGLEIYQISLDADKHMWKNAASNIPWTTVLDPESVYSQIAGLYNVKQLPTVFILDKKGNLVKRVETMTQLENEVKSVL